jgi:hypothetical protein
MGMIVYSPPSLFDFLPARERTIIPIVPSSPKGLGPAKLAADPMMA